MTGYGRGESASESRTVTVEIRSVNHRYCEVSVKLPSKYAFVEDAVKTLVKNKVRRGKIDVNIQVLSTADEDTDVQVNKPAARQYFNSLRELQRGFDVTGDISLELLASMPDVIKSVRPSVDEDAISAIFLSAVSAALANHDDMRSAEGMHLSSDILGRADILTEKLALVEAKADTVPAAYAKRLEERLDQLLSGNVVDREIVDQRVAVELAVFADKATIAEEITRLRSHIAQLHKLLSGSGDEPIGKKLDFLVQEMNREANTIGSKANDIEITENMLELKSEIENIREQVQNIC
jgi:uncharacterized protein (TIGR00255 family)